MAIKKIDASGGYAVIDDEHEVGVVKSESERDRSGKKLRIGIVGLGAIAQRSHIPNLANASRAEIVAVCDPLRERAESVSRIWSIERWCTDFRELLSMKDIDAVSICTPNYLHAPMTIAACNAGKHVLCEKPMATTIEDARRMIAESRENKVKLEIAEFKIFTPIYEVIKEVIDQGLIGEVLTARTKIAHGGPEGWSPVTGEWFYRKNESGYGALLDLGGKQITLMRWLLGDEVSSVMGKVGILSKKNSEVEDHAVGVVRFTKGALCVLEASWCTNPGFKGTEIVGTKGTIFADYPNTTLEVRLTGKIDGVLKPNVPEESRKGNPFQRFVDCVLDDKEPDITPESELKTLEVIMALYESSAREHEVKL